MSALAPLLQAYFTDRLLHQRHASPNTIASYRDTFRLLLKFVNAKTGKTPSKISLEDLDAALIGAFLTHLENERSNSVAPATHGSPRSIPSSSTCHWKPLNTPR